MRKFGIVVSGIVFSVFLHGCGNEKTINYQEEKMTISEAEEKIADQLEVENSDLDVEVTITEESDE